MSSTQPYVFTRRRLLQAAGAGGAALLVPSWARGAGLPPSANLRDDSVVVRWNEALLDRARESKLGPPMVARALAVAHTCAYDAWAAFDRVAVGTQLGGALRQPVWARSLANKEKAISFAVYLAAVDLFPESRARFDTLMGELGYDPADSSGAAGVGAACAQAVIDFRREDGANQPGGYADPTGYQPVNEPMDTRFPLDPATVRDPDRWQPLTYPNPSGTLVTPGYIGSHWGEVTPFGSPPAPAATPPARFGSTEYVAQARALLDTAASLTDVQKVIAEYWADGPRSELPPGHWNLFAQHVARRDRHGATEHGVDLDTKLFLALTNAVHDAGICAWGNKRAWDSVRPITALRYLFQGQQVRSWNGTIDGAEWFPYQPTFFPTPPFPEYSSGHSNFSAAGAEILRQFTRSDRFDASATIPAHTSRIEEGVPSTDVTLHWATFSEAADEAGISRRYGGIHFQQGDLDARATGRRAARAAWAKAQAYFAGTA